MKTSSSISREEALACTPVKNPDIVESHSESGDLVLTYPIQVKPWIAGAARFIGRGPLEPVQKKLQLDSLGSAVWRLMDGRRSVAEIIRQFADTHRLHAREAEVSVTRFIRELGKRGLVGLQ